MKQLNIPISEDLHRRLKTQAAAEGTTIGAVVIELVEGWVLYREKSKKQPASLLAVSVDSTPSLYPGAGIKNFTTEAVSTKTVKPSTAKRPMPDLTKEAQAKGKMGR